MLGHEEIALPTFAQCVDASQRPQGVKKEDWLKEGDIYIVTTMAIDKISGEPAVTLLGKSPGAGYDSYLADRFAIGLHFSVN